MKILFLTPRFPYPVIGGDRLKPYNILSHLGKEHEITLVSFFHGGEPPKCYTGALEDLGVEVITVPLNPVRAGLRSMLRLFSKFPLEILFYTQPEMAKLVNKLTSERDYDLAFAFFMRTAEYLKDLPLKKILMAEDCRTLYQKRSYEESVNLKQKLIRFWEYRKLRKYEPEIVNHFNLTTLVTNDDIKSMQAQNPNVEYRLLTNGTDVNKFNLPDDPNRSGMLFAGKLDVWANVLMIRNIVNNILPVVRSKVPGAVLNIVGANPPQSIVNIAKSTKNINLISDVPEMHPYLQGAELFIHPHTGGSGIQNKLLEAMACGCPVVTTPTGNQGIDGVNGQDLLIGQNNDELAEHAIKILSDKKFAADISVNGRKLIERTHSWYVVFDALDNLIYELFEKPKVINPN